MTEHLHDLERHLAPARARLLAHPIYAAVDTEARLRRFMEHHVFAVWDFMSIVKSLQRQLTCVAVPWLPTADPAARRLINEIVLAEESDDDGRGGYLSHFELYLDAMEDLGADTTAVRRLCSAVAHGVPVGEALHDPSIPAPARTFVTGTFAVLDHAAPCEIAAAFTFGREDVIPDMFRQFVATLSAAAPRRFERLRYYLDRHIDIDGDEHGPKARRLVSALCGDDPTAWAAVARAATSAIENRVQFWDGVQASLPAAYAGASAIARSILVLSSM